MPARVPTASRRTTLGLAAAGVLGAAAGCDADSPLPGGDDGDSPTASPPPQDADSRLVDQVRAEVVATLAAVRGARGRPPLADAVSALEAMHLTHLAALDGDRPARQPRRTPAPWPRCDSGSWPASSATSRPSPARPTAPSAATSRRCSPP